VQDPGPSRLVPAISRQSDQEIPSSADCTLVRWEPRRVV
jgi:hypothetical protein